MNPLVKAPYETCWRSECRPGCYYDHVACEFRPADDEDESGSTP